MSDEIKAGDVVRLKSGGPKMTARDVQQNGRIMCDWFAWTYGPNTSNQDKRREGMFDSASLFRIGD